MVRKGTGASEGEVKVFVSRFGHDPVTVNVPKDSTVEYVLGEAGVEITGTQTVFILGQEANMEDLVDDKDVLSVVTPKQAGGDDEETVGEEK